MKYYKLLQTISEIGCIITYNPSNLENDELIVFDKDNEIVLKINTSDEKLNEFLNNQVVELIEISEIEAKKFINTTIQGKNIINNQKNERNNLLNNQLTSLNNYSFNINEDSMNRFNRILSLTNFKYNKLIFEGSSIEDAFKVYNSKINWKSDSGEFVELSILQLAELLEIGINDMQTLWENYN